MRPGETVDASVQNDTSLLYGEIGSSPLQSIQAMLTSQYLPLDLNSNEWGRANVEQKDAFNVELSRFTNSISTALDSFKNGPLLRRSDNPIFDSFHKIDKKSLIQSISDKSTFFSHLEDLLEEWCEQIESYLSPCNARSKESSMSLDLGPKGELKYWRSRMQLVTSVTEQVNSQHCKQVIDLLSEATKSPGDDSKAKIMLLLRRWRQVDIFITETANEAKDNIKYLSSLQRFVDPFYHGSINAMVDAVPALLNSVKVRVLINGIT